MVKPVPVFGRPVLVEPMCLFDAGDGRQRRGQRLGDELRQDAWGLVGKFDNRHEQDGGDCRSPQRDLASYADYTWRSRCRLRRRTRGDPVRQAPIDEQGPYLIDAEIALVAIAFAHDVQQNRPFAFHQQPVVPTPVAFGADKIRVHEGLDLRSRQPSLHPSAGRVLPILAKPCQSGNLRFVHLCFRVENA